MSTPGDGTDGRSGWCGRGAHHRCIGAYDVPCGCSCHLAELSDPAATPSAPEPKETSAMSIVATTPTGTRHPVEEDHPAPVVGRDGDRSEFIAELETVIRQWHRDPAEYDLPAMDAALDDPGYTWGEPLNFARLMSAHYIPGRTEVPCPEFCSKPHGHPFDDGGTRTHQRGGFAPSLSCRESVVLDIEQHEERDDSDDATVRRLDPVVFLAFDGDELSVDDARKIAAALTAAADRLQRITQ